MLLLHIITPHLISHSILKTFCWMLNIWNCNWLQFQLDPSLRKKDYQVALLSKRVQKSTQSLSGRIWNWTQDIWFEAFCSNRVQTLWPRLIVRLDERDSQVKRSREFCFLSIWQQIQRSDKLPIRQCDFCFLKKGDNHGRHIGTSLFGKERYNE